MFDWKKFIPHAASVAIMALVSILYCYPVLQGKSIVQDDIINFKSLSKEIVDYREANGGEEPLWTTRVFSGMTTFFLSTLVPGNINDAIHTILAKLIPKGANVIFITMLGFFILLLAFEVNPWLALAGAIAYGLSSNLLVSLVAGHNTKVIAIGYMAPALGAVALTLRGKRIIGGLLTMLFVGLLVKSGHYQIMYYFLLVCLVIGGVHLYHAIRAKTLPKLLINLSMIFVAATVGLLPNAGKLYNVYQHQGETIRGGTSQLSKRMEETKSGGLDKGYAMRWSYAPFETFTAVVPSLMGGASTEAVPDGGNVAEELKKFNISKQQRESILKNAPTYVGDQPFTIGTVYFGAGFIFLFVLAAFLVSGAMRGWVLGAIIMSLILSWGRHADIITGFLFDHFPMYNKFRTPSMAMSIAGLIIPFFGMFGLHHILSGKFSQSQVNRALRLTVYITGGLMAVLCLYGLTTDWIGPKDVQFQGQKNSPWAIDSVYQALLADRKGKFLTDWFISTALMGLTAILVWFSQKGSIKQTSFVAILAIAFGADMWHVSKRYLDNDDFSNERAYESVFEPTPADQAILADAEPHFRVINLTRSPWTDGLTSYWHENIGGHHPAKLQRYQDLIENQLSPQLQQINSGLMQNQSGIELNRSVSDNMTAFNMLNTKYYILQADNPAGAVKNPSACGNAWFVSDIQKVENADQEMQAISGIDPNETAIIHSDFADELYNYSFGKSNALIELQESTPNYLKYSTQNTEKGLAVFSEIYYPIGWNAWIDGVPTEIYRANYLLRALKIPAGEHTVEMRFEPASYGISTKLSYAGSALYLLFAGGLLFAYFKKPKPESSVT